MYAQVRIYLCMCTCARTHQTFEYQLQAADAEFTDDESGAGVGGATQDQRGTEAFKGKVSCVVCYDIPVLPFFAGHATLANDRPLLLCHPEECVM